METRTQYMEVAHARILIKMDGGPSISVGNIIYMWSPCIADQTAVLIDYMATKFDSATQIGTLVVLMFLSIVTILQMQLPLVTLRGLQQVKTLGEMLNMCMSYHQYAKFLLFARCKSVREHKRSE